MHRFRAIASAHHLITTAAGAGAGAGAGVVVAPPLRHHTLFKRTLILQTAAEPVRIERLTGADSGILELKLNRPEVKNAINTGMLKGLQDALEVIAGDASARVVLVSSAIRGLFCAGADLKERKRMAASEVQVYAHSLRATLSSLQVLPIPTVAVIEGPALGGGLELALSCDLRICGEDAIFGMPETGLAIIPGAGGTQRLPREVGRPVAKELIFTGRRIDGKEALSRGLVNHCVHAGETYSKALEIARDINEKGPIAIRMAKQAINRGMEVDIKSGLVVEGECYDQLLDTDDRLEGLAAFAEKRKPIYAGK